MKISAALPLLSSAFASPLSETPIQIIEPGNTVTGSSRFDPRDVGVNTEDFNSFKLYAQYAGASYCNPVADILGFIAVDSTAQEIVISVRGPLSLVNWVADVVWAREPANMCDGCWVHFGFLFAYEEIASSVNTSLTSAIKLFPSYKITVTGHSLGGAVATLLGMYIRDAGYGADVYTYGSPRVGNQALARYITHQSSNNYRVTHLGDAVARLPPMQIGFRHTSPEYWLSDGTPRTVDYDPDDVVVCTGYYNIACNSGEPWWQVDLTSHFYYLVAISHCGESTPRLSLGRVPDTRADSGPGPVNGTTATNSTSGGLDPTVADNVAMQAKLDQAYANALAADNGAMEIVF